MFAGNPQADDFALTGGCRRASGMVPYRPGLAVATGTNHVCRAATCFVTNPTGHRCSTSCTEPKVDFQVSGGTPYSKYCWRIDARAARAGLGSPAWLISPPCGKSCGALSSS